jgi:DnaJ-domain-containing protein 1
MGLRSLFWLALAYVIWRVYQDLYNKAKSARRPTKSPAFVDDSLPPNWACECLGVKPDAPKKAVKTAYQGLVKQYHPDRVDGMGAEIRELAEKRTKEINQAYFEFKKRW